MTTLCLCLVAISCLAGGAGAAEPFKVYDGTLFNDKPRDLQDRGFHPIPIAYETSFEWPSGKRDMPSKESVQKLALQWFKGGHTQMQFDLESDGFWHGAWFAPDDATRQHTADKLVTIAGWVHEVVPEMKVGFYNFTPQQAAYATNIPAQTPRWRELNVRFFQRVADVSGHMSPRLYTFFPDDEPFWMKDAEQVLQLAREMGQDKLVLPYVWFQTHGGGDAKLWFAPVPAEFFRRQLEKIHAEGADGVIIWGGYNETWNEDAEWWKVTKEFLATNPQVLRKPVPAATQPATPRP
jgi:hypothetical protein